MSSSIDMQDHYSYIDLGLQLPQVRRLHVAPHQLTDHYQNRLRCSDHEVLFLQAGFEIPERQVTSPTAEDDRALAEIELAPRFTNYTTEDLGVRAATFVTRASG